MIARFWRARATAGGVEAYRRHFNEAVRPELAQIRGHAGAYFLTRSSGREEEVLVLTLWDSMAAVEAFAGADPDRAVVGPEARAALIDFDDRVLHYQVLDRPVSVAPPR